MKKKSTRGAVLIGIFLLMVSAVSLWYILVPRERASGYIADLYQEGKLILSIPLSAVPEAYTFTVTGSDGCKNQVEVRPGSIGIVSADCPDKLCVRQGFLSDSVLPVTCLPNRLVIRLRPAALPSENDQEAVDIITY